MKKIYISLVALLVAASSFAQVQLQNHSLTPALVNAKKGIPGLEVFSLIGSDDVLPQSPGYIFGGSADGAGLMKNLDGTYSFVVNHEDNFAVGKVTLDNTFKPIKGEYIMTSKAGMWRLCSATLATPEEHGFGPKFLTCGESGQESMTHAIDFTAPARTTFDSLTLAKGLGRWSAENALPLNKNVYPSKTVIVLTDDDSGPNGGQVVVYVANTVGDLNNGKLYVLRRKDLNKRETDMIKGTSYPVELVEFPANYKSFTGSKLDAISDTLKSIKFGRVEDVDAGKGSLDNNRNVYFTVTGQDYTGVNADRSRTKFGRVYCLTLDAASPLSGTLTCIMDGDNTSLSNPVREFYDVDNICVTEDYVYVQEDPNGYVMNSFEKHHEHDARIYQYDIETGAVNVVMELDHHRSATDSAKFNVGRNASTGAYEYKKSGFGSWEFGAMLDISDMIGIPDVFMVAVQPHTWIAAKYKGVDTIVNGGANIRKNEDQASQIIIVKGIPRKKATTSINNASADMFSVYPNPSAGRYSLSFENTNEAVIEVFNASGQLVFSEKVTAKGKAIKEINLTEQANGNYFVRMAIDGKQLQKVITKQ